jgi:hypothetical protein
MQEYRGIMLMLKEAHLQFDIIEDTQIERHAERLKKYKIVIFPDITYLSENAIKLLQNVSKDGVNLIATNNSFSDNAQALKSLFGAEVIKKEMDGTGNYLKIDNPNLFGRLKGQSMIHWKFNLAQYDFEKTNTKHLPVLAKGRPGPPELIGGHDPMGYFGMSVKNFGTSKNVILPLNLGKLYYLHGYEQNKNILLDILQYLNSQVFEGLKTNAHPRVEMILKEFKYNVENKKKATDGKILHLINLTGFSGNTFFEPLPVHQIQVSIKSERIPKKAFYLSSKKPISYSAKNGELSFTVAKLGNYEAVVFEY